MSAEVIAAVDRLLAEPDQLDDLVSELIAAIPREVPSYRQVPVESLRDGNRHVLVTALSHLRDGRLPQPAELRELNEIGRLRARQGIDLASVLAGYQVAGQRFWEIFSADLEERGAGAAQLLAVTKLIWQWLDAVTVAVASAHREVELRTAREDERRVGDALRALLLRPEPPAACAQHLLAVGLDPDGRYVAFRGRPADGAPPGALRDAVMARGSGGDVATAVLHNDVVGVADPDVIGPTLPGRLGVFGAGPATTAALLRGSYVTASRALTAALRLGRTGVNRLGDLRLAGAAATDPEMTQVIRDRILRPLRVRRRYADELWRSVVGYLEHGQQVDAAARTLHVHPNTLRHRLAIFTDLTGVDLRQPADIAEVWWLAAAGASPHDGAD